MSRSLQGFTLRPSPIRRGPWSLRVRPTMERVPWLPTYGPRNPPSHVGLQSPYKSPVVGLVPPAPGSRASSFALSGPDPRLATSFSDPPGDGPTSRPHFSSVCFGASPPPSEPVPGSPVRAPRSGGSSSGPLSASSLSGPRPAEGLLLPLHRSGLGRHPPTSRPRPAPPLAHQSPRRLGVPPSPP